MRPPSRKPARERRPAHGTTVLATANTAAESVLFHCGYPDPERSGTSSPSL
jgi:hypothetical protein